MWMLACMNLDKGIETENVKYYKKTLVAIWFYCRM